MVKNSPANAGDIRDVGSLPGSGRSPGGGHGSSLQYSCLENPMDRGAWQATVHGIAKSQLKRLSTHAHTHISLHVCVCVYIYIYLTSLSGVGGNGELLVKEHKLSVRR